MKERLFVTPEYTTAREIKQIRKELHLTQKEFAEFINCSKPTIERWERSKEVIRGPIVPFLKMLQKYPEYEQEVKVPEKVWPQPGNHEDGCRISWKGCPCGRSTGGR